MNSIFDVEENRVYPIMSSEKVIGFIIRIIEETMYIALSKTEDDELILTDNNYEEEFEIVGDEARMIRCCPLGANYLQE